MGSRARCPGVRGEEDSSRVVLRHRRQDAQHGGHNRSRWFSRHQVRVSRHRDSSLQTGPEHLRRGPLQPVRIYKIWFPYFPFAHTFTLSQARVCPSFRTSQLALDYSADEKKINIFSSLFVAESITSWWTDWWCFSISWRDWGYRFSTAYRPRSIVRPRWIAAFITLHWGFDIRLLYV